MAPTFLKRARDFMPQRSLKYLLHSHFSGYEDARPLKRVHASELSRSEGLCPRLYALYDLTETELPKNYLSASENVTFGMGRRLQDDLVHAFADMGKAISHWVCLGCDHQHDFQKRPEECEVCGCRAFRPEEVRFKSKISGASCGVDMLLRLSPDRLTPVEIKTMDKDQFKGLVAPLAEHRLRTNFYLRLIDESEDQWPEDVDTEEAIILYTTKGGFGCADPELAKWGFRDKFSPFKDYPVTRDDKLTQAMHDRAMVVAKFRKKEIGMPVGVCPTAMANRAKFCPLKKPCWSGQYPAEYDWTKK